MRFHDLRFNQTRSHFYQQSPVKLEEIISIPDDLDDTVYRCRIVYSKEIETIEFIPYQPKKIQTLRIVECNEIDYSFKYADRTLLNQLFEKREGCDDILIVRDGKITDTSSANIIFFDGKKWITPAEPLLRGTKRSQLLAENTLEEKQIKCSDLNSFIHAKLINALLDEGPEILIKSIIH